MPRQQWIPGIYSRKLTSLIRANNQTDERQLAGRELSKTAGAGVQGIKSKARATRVLDATFSTGYNITGRVSWLAPLQTRPYTAQRRTALEYV